MLQLKHKRNPRPRRVVDRTLESSTEGGFHSGRENVKEHLSTIT